MCLCIEYCINISNSSNNSLSMHSKNTTTNQMHAFAFHIWPSTTATRVYDVYDTSVCFFFFFFLLCFARFTKNDVVISLFLCIAFLFAIVCIHNGNRCLFHRNPYETWFRWLLIYFWLWMDLVLVSSWNLIESIRLARELNFGTAEIERHGFNIVIVAFKTTLLTHTHL